MAKTGVTGKGLFYRTGPGNAFDRACFLLAGLAFMV
jgi:hypothetical protein